MNLTFDWNKSLKLDSRRIQEQGSAKVHRVHILGGTSEDLINDDPIGFFCGMKRIPKRI